MRRTMSATDFVRVKSKLKTTIKNRMNPLFTNKNQHSPETTSPKSSICNNNNDEIPASVLAAAPSLKLNKESGETKMSGDTFSNTLPMVQSSALNSQFSLFNRPNMHPLFLNVPTSHSQPYLNSLQLQALLQVAAFDANINALNSTHSSLNPLKNHHVTSFSMSSLSNHGSNHVKRQRTSEPSIEQHAGNRALFIPQYANISHVEEESEISLANELKDASKNDEKIKNAFLYGDDDNEDEDADEEEEVVVDRRLRGFHSYNRPLSHRHSKNLLKKLSSYSDPHIMRSNVQNIEDIAMSNESLSHVRTLKRHNDRRNTLNAENEMEFATNQKSNYKYTTGK